MGLCYQLFDAADIRAYQINEQKNGTKNFLTYLFTYPIDNQFS